MAEPVTVTRDRRGWLTWLRRSLVAITVLSALLVAWAVLPRSLGEVRVEDVRLRPVPGAYDSRKPAYHPTPVRIAVTFTTDEDLEAVRQRRDLGYVAVRLADCRRDAAHTLEVVTQRAEYLHDGGRVPRRSSSW